MSNQRPDLPPSKTLVAAIGGRDAKCVLILDQPDRYEIKSRRLFSGRDAQNFIKCMHRAAIPTNEMYVTAVIKDQDEALKTDISWSKKSGVTITQRAKKYIEYLRWELEKLEADTYCVCGNAALYALTGRWGIHNWRGSIIDSTLIPGKKVVATLMPWNIRINGVNSFLIEADLKTYKEIISGTYIPTQRDLMIRPSFRDAIDFLRYCKDEGLNGKIIAYDIEVNNYHEAEQKAGLIPQVSCISFSVNMRSMCIPFLESTGDYFPDYQEADIWYEIGLILEDRRIQKLGQNVIFDCHFLLRTYGIKARNLHDTMIAQQTLLTELPKGLDLITSLWTDHPYYKEDGKAFFAMGSKWDTFYKYNATDSIICDEVFPKQMEQLKATGNWETYNRQRLLIEPLTFMMERGIKVDVQAMKAEYFKLGEEQKNIEYQLEKICGEGFNPRSQKDLHAYFYGKKHLKPYRKRKADGTMGVSYDETAMKRIIRKGYKEAKMIQEVKHLNKTRSNYLDVAKVDIDGRYRCAFNPVGTMFSRLASKANIFGTGGNMQNWAKPLRRFWHVDDGYVGYAIDLSQAENRIVAYEGKVLPMIEAFETGKDVHTLTAQLIMRQILGAEMAANTDPRSLCPLGDGTHKWRDWGKKANHGFNYDWGYKAFALRNEMPEKDGEAVYNGYHSSYPEIQDRYHANIRKALHATRTVTNLRGRKTLFLSDLNDTTYKAAYSCIPQGTVGDIMNEQAIEYIYFDQYTFHNVELMLQVHDEIIFQIPISIGWEEHARLLTLILRSLEPVLTTSWGYDFVIPAELSMIKTYYVAGDESKGIPPGGAEIGRCLEARDDIAEFAKLLQNNWEVINGTEEKK